MAHICNDLILQLKLPRKFDLNIMGIILIGRYIVDFVCHERGIIIEVDGGHHSIYKDRDRERDIWLNRQGYKVLRFWNNEVLTNIEGVLEVIRENCLTHPPLTPPIKGGERCEGSPSREGKLPTRNEKEP